MRGGVEARRGITTSSGHLTLQGLAIINPIYDRPPIHRDFRPLADYSNIAQESVSRLLWGTPRPCLRLREHQSGVRNNPNEQRRDDIHKRHPAPERAEHSKDHPTRKYCPKIPVIRSSCLFAKNLYRCERCRRQKIKCSGRRPCDSCKRRSVSCRFNDSDQRILVSKGFVDCWSQLSTLR